MGRVGLATSALAVGALALFACAAARLPAPRYGSQPGSALADVPYPPPPARVEFVPKQPTEKAVWIDGEWVWRGRRWAWRAGRWVVAPANARYAPWTAVRSATGQLYIAQGAWRSPDGTEVPEPKPLAVGRATAGSGVSPEGEEVPWTPLQSPSEDGGAPEVDRSTLPSAEGATLVKP